MSESPQKISLTKTSVAHFLFGLKSSAPLIFSTVLNLGMAACGGESPVVEDDMRYEVSADGAPSLGSPNAAVTLVEFVDIQCPYCSVSARRVKTLLNDFPNDLRIVFRHFPIPNLHPRAIPAAKAVECAEDQGQFWEMLDKLVDKDSRLDDEAINLAADELGLDMEIFSHCLKTTSAQLRINTDWQMGIDLEIHATPTLFVNGLRVVGLQSTDRLRSLIRSEIKAAKGDEKSPSQQVFPDVRTTDKTEDFKTPINENLSSVDS